jgi:uncharacterized membrane protein
MHPVSFTASHRLIPFGTTVVVATIASIAIASAAHAQQPFFMGLGHLPGASWSRAFDVSSDGSTVIGSNRVTPTSGVDHGFRWTRETGMLALGTSPNVSSTVPVRISGDGQTIVGRTYFFNIGTGFAFKWTQATGPVLLPRLQGTGAEATGLTFNGQTIVGSNAFIDGQYDYQACRWTAAGPELLFGSDNRIQLEDISLMDR